MWEKRRNECISIKDVVCANTGMTEEELRHRKASYRIDGLDEAAEIIRQFVYSDKPITVVGDFDSDGINACAIMFKALMAMGKRPKIRIPRRISEGYGLSDKIVDEISEGLLITVDNGIVANDAIKKAKDKGLTVIVTDHHLPGEVLPDADIVIDPNAIPNSADFNSYCGAGIAYKLAIKLLGEGHELIPKLCCFAAIATVADVMPLISENRFIVQDGLKYMTSSSTRTVGLGALLQLCDMDKVITSKNIAFKIAPILNAPGRMDDDGAMDSLRLLCIDRDINVAKTMAQALINVNEARKAEKADGIEKIKKNIVENCLFAEIPLCIYEPGLKEGLLGIYAGALAQEFKVPCFVFTDSEDDPDLLKGSGRSFGGIHLKELLDKNADVLEKFGGHAEAAGVTVRRVNFETMRDNFIESLSNIEPAEEKLYYDLELSPDDVVKTIEELEQYAPFGEGNEEIIFLIKDFKLSPGINGYYKSMGSEQQHIKLFGKNQVTAVAFDMSKKFTNMGYPKAINLIGYISNNYFMGKAYPQIEVVDMEGRTLQKPQTSLASMLAKKAASH